MPGETFQKRINKQGLDYIAGLQAAVGQLYDKCCEEDQIPLGSKFCVFSDDNKYLPFYNNALTQLWEAEAQYKAGGYVGLQISHAKSLSR